MATEDLPRYPLCRHVSSFEDGVMSDGVVAIFPDDPEYERHYQYAVRAHQRYGKPMLYASQALIDQTLAERAEAAAS